MANRGLHHLAIRARDVACVERFYADVVGCEVLRRQEDEAGLRSSWVALGETSFLAIERADVVPATVEGSSDKLACIALAIEPSERESVRRRLASLGHPVFKETAHTLYVKDPEDNVIGFSHYPHAAPHAETKTSSLTGMASKLAALALGLGSLLALGGGPTASAQQNQGATPAAAPAPRARPAATRAPRTPPDVLLVGSSSVNGAFGRLIESELNTSGMHVERRGHSSTGLARPDFFDWEAEVAHMGDLRSMRGVVVVLGGNDTQAIRLRPEEVNGSRGHDSWIIWRDEQRWTQIYTARVRAFVDALCTAGAPHVAVLLPADGERDGWSDRIHRVQEAQAAGTRASRCGVVIDPRGGRVRTGATVDGVHLSRTGARDVWDRIRESMVQALPARTH